MKTWKDIKIGDYLTIMGTGRSLSDVSQYITTDLWGTNNGYLSIARYYSYLAPTVWFEIHDIRKDKRGKWRRRGERTHGSLKIETHLDYLNQLSIPVMMHNKNEIVKKSIEYPFQLVLDSFEYHYFTCTFCWQMALAILLKYKGIAIYGADMDDYWERRYQRPALEYWLGLAEGKGIETFVSKESPLLKGPFLYGFDKKNYYLYQPFYKR